MSDTEATSSNEPGAPASRLNIAAPTDPRIENYLDHMYAPLVGIIPYERRQELRSEWREHLLTLAEETMKAGKDRETALVESLKQFGPPEQLARDWLQEESNHSSSAESKSVWPSVGVGLAWFMGASLLMWAILLGGYYAGGNYYHFFTQMDLYMVLFFPLALGFCIGWTAPGRHALATFIALSATILINFLVSLLLPESLTMQELRGVDLGFFFPLVQSFYWPPLVFLTLIIGKRMRRRSNRIRRYHTHLLTT